MIWAARVSLEAGLDVRVVLAAITWNVKKIWTVYVKLQKYAYIRNDVRLHIYLFHYRTKSSKDRIAQLARQSSLPWKLPCDRVRGHSIAETLPLSARRTKCSLPVYSTEPAAMSIWCAYTASLTVLLLLFFKFFF